MSPQDRKTLAESRTSYTIGRSLADDSNCKFRVASSWRKEAPGSNSRRLLSPTQVATAVTTLCGRRHKGLYQSENRATSIGMLHIRFVVSFSACTKGSRWQAVTRSLPLSRDGSSSWMVNELTR